MPFVVLLVRTQPSYVKYSDSHTYLSPPSDASNRDSGVCLGRDDIDDRAGQISMKPRHSDSLKSLLLKQASINAKHQGYEKCGSSYASLFFKISTTYIILGVLDLHNSDGAGAH